MSPTSTPCGLRSMSRPVSVRWVPQLPQPLSRRGPLARQVRCQAVAETEVATPTAIRAPAAVNLKPSPSGPRSGPYVPVISVAPANVTGHFLAPPIAGNAAPLETESLLLIAPGAMLTPNDLSLLATSVQAEAKGVRLWVGVLNFNYPAMFQQYGGPGLSMMDSVQRMQDAGALQEMVDDVLVSAGQQGFKPRRAKPGRCDNLYVLGQSAGGLLFSNLAKRQAGGLILLASSCDGNYMKQCFAAIEANPSVGPPRSARPVMYLNGEVDGQVRWFYHTPYAAQAVAAHAKFGSRYACTRNPVVLLPGVNHGHTSNGFANIARGDIMDGVATYESAQEQAAAAVAAFLTANIAVDPAVREAAIDKMMQLTEETFSYMTPYTRALGYGDVHAAIQQYAGVKTPEPVEITSSSEEDSPCLPESLVPQMKSIAESYAAAAQLQLCSSLPTEALQRLHVVATVHSDEASLARSQPTCQHLPDGRLQVHVHLLPHFTGSEAVNNPQPALRPMAPEYWMKLKSADMVAWALGLPSSSSSIPQPSVLGQSTLAQALERVPTKAQQRYHSTGRKISFGLDRAFGTADLPTTPETFFTDARITLNYPAVNTEPGPKLPTRLADEEVVISYPFYQPQLPAVMPADLSSTEALGLGCVMTKAMSLAQIMEWVMLDCLRASQTAW